ncbi:MAG: sulfatase [Opitutaceae bacterium]|nr:sulfatase [Opitutaceae bacterium]
MRGWARRRFLKASGLAVAGLLMPLSSLAQETNAKPNFLFVAVDDLNHYSSFLAEEEGNFLSIIYPDAKVRKQVAKRLTPNMQRLAEQSTVFTRAYCPSPLCGPSRTALMTGVPTHLSGYYGHDVHFRRSESLKDVVTLPQFLKANGYFTAGLGKIYHLERVDEERGDFPDTKYSWNEWVEADVGIGGPGLEKSFSKYSPKYDRLLFGPSNLEAEETHDFRNAKFASELLMKGTATMVDLRGKERTVSLPEDKPFFLAAGLFVPHLPWHPPAEFFERFPLDEMELGEETIQWVRDDVKDLPDAGKVFLDHFFEQIIQHGNGIDGPGGGLEAWKASIQGYLATTAFADYCLGQLINAVEEHPEADNTVVVLWSDHGWNLGDKARYRKQALWDSANHCVLMIRDPQVKASAKGARSNRLASLQDLYPTLVKRAGLEVPSHVHGYDLAETIAGETFEGEQMALQTHKEGNHAIRTPEYRYIRYEDGSEELYFWEVDPFEYVNRAGMLDAESKKALDDMRGKMDEVLEMGAGDYGR